MLQSINRPPLTIVLIAYVAFIALGLFDGLLGVAWPAMRATFDLPLDALGLLLMVSAIGHILASFGNGRFIQLTSIATLLILAQILRGGSLFFQAVAPSWLLVVVIGLIGSLGVGVLDSSLNTYAAARFRPRLLNWLHASFAVGASLGSLLMTALLGIELLNEAGSWRFGFGILAAANLLLAVVFFVTRRQWTLPHQHLPSDSAAQSSITTRDTLKLPIVWVSILTLFLYTGLEISVGRWVFTLAVDSRGLTETTAGVWTTLYWGSFTVGRIILGFIETNTERLVRLMLLLVTLGAGTFALNLSETMSLVGLLLIGFGLAPVFPALIALTPQRINPEHAPNAIGFQVGAAGTGAAVLPGIAGVLGHKINLELMALFFLATAVLLFLAQETATRMAKTSA